MGKQYEIKRVTENEIEIKSECYDSHIFDLKEFKEFFHVSKE